MSEIICDGVHIHPSMIRAAFKMMGAERMIFISDSMRATGMPDGQYTLGGLDVKVTGNRATLVSDGALTRFCNKSCRLHANSSYTDGNSAGNSRSLCYKKSCHQPWNLRRKRLNQYWEKSRYPSP